MANDYPCPFCGEVKQSRQAKAYHIKHCAANPENMQASPGPSGTAPQEPAGAPPVVNTPPPALSDAGPVIEANRKDWESQHGRVPKPAPKEKELEVKVAPSGQEDDNSIWIVIGIIVVSIFVGVMWLLKDSAVEFLTRKKPPQRPGPSGQVVYHHG